MAKPSKTFRKPVMTKEALVNGPARIIDAQAKEIEAAKQAKIERLRNARVLKDQAAQASKAPTEAEASQDIDYNETIETQVQTSDEEQTALASDTEASAPESVEEVAEASGVAETSETPAEQAPDAPESAEASAEEQKSEAPAEETPAPAAPIADLKAMLSAVVAQYAPALTEAQKAEMLASDAALKAAADAFNALNDKQKEDFAQIVGIKTRRATVTAKAKKTDIAPELKALACEVFTVSHPTQEQYAFLARAANGELIGASYFNEINPMYLQDKDRYVDAPRAKDKRTNKRIQVAIDQRDLQTLEQAVAFIEKAENYTGRRLCRSYGRLAQIALEVQNTRAAAALTPDVPAAEAQAQA